MKVCNSKIKHALDCGIIIITIPIWGILCLLIIFFIKNSNPKEKIFFKQKRLGLEGKEFICYKFRTMTDNQSFMRLWLIEHPEENEYYQQYHKYMDDPRVTKIGKFLRQTSLDELPQLINVLKGDMSLVGPRPYMISEKNKIDKYLSLILSVKPGITGLWQVNGRSNIDFIGRVEMDILYVRNRTLWQDFKILFKTIKIVLKRHGAS